MNWNDAIQQMNEDRKADKPTPPPQEPGKHSPTPWRFVQSDNLILDANDALIGQCFSNSNGARKPIEERDANAKLIVESVNFREGVSSEEMAGQTAKVWAEEIDCLTEQYSYADKLEDQLSTLRRACEEKDSALDLNADEFTRIKAICNSEIQGICDRAVQRTNQTVPLIAQRDTLVKKYAALKVVCEEIIASGRPHGGKGSHQFPDGCECEICENWDTLNRILKLQSALDNLTKGETK